MSRGYFYDEDDARGIAAQLLKQGFSAEVGRESFAGEDDDEDRYWAVTTDAPDVALELLADAVDGWVEYEESPTLRPAPIELPREPKRRT